MSKILPSSLSSLASVRNVLTAIVAASFSIASHAEPKLLDRIVAVVNKSVITDGELKAAVATVHRNLAQQNVIAPPLAELRKQILERLVTERLLVDYGADTGLRIDEATLDRSVEKVAEQNKLTMAQFKVALERDGFTLTRFREDLRQDMLIQRLREREIDSRVYVTDTEIDQFIKSQGNKTEQEYKLNHILVGIPEGATSEQIRAKQQKIESAYSALVSGLRFAEVAARYSESPDGLSGGDLGWRASGRLPPLFLEALEATKIGQTTQILRSPAGFHIFLLNAQRARDNTEVIQQSRVKHILVKVNEITSDSDARNRIVLVRDRILSGANFDEQAKLYSEDGSARRGGDLDWVSPGDTVPEFETAMSTLTLGQLSDPVRTPFGWHLLQVTERRTQDVTKEKERARIRAELRQRKADEQYDDWVRQQRDRAFVELRLDDQ